jgi:hypothetical protein
MQALLREGHRASFRDGYAPLPSCRISRFLAAAFAIAVSATLLSLPRLVDARAGCEIANTPSPLGVLSTVNVYPKRRHSRPSGRACCFVLRYRLGIGVPLWGPPPHPGPAVHSDGNTALHCAAQHGNYRIVGLLVASGAAVNLKDKLLGCAVSACGESAVSAPAESPPPSAVQAHAAALCRVQWPFQNCRGAAAARRQGNRIERQGIRREPSHVTLRCAAQPNRNRNSRARAGRRRSNSRQLKGSSRSTRRERGRCTPPAASRPPPTPLASRPILPRAACAVGVCRRRSPIRRGGRQQPTQHTHVAVALAAHLVHYCTRGSKCRAHRARTAAAVGSAKCARARSAVPRTASGGLARTAMWDRRAVHANARAARRSASSPFRPLSRRNGFGVSGRAAS